MTDANDEFEVKLAEVIRFVVEEIPRPRPRRITANTDLRGDLHMLPEDADDLMGKFAKTFGVSAGDFELSRYFPPEGSLLTALLSELVSGRQNPAAKSIRLTVGMLAGAARDGVWQSAALEREFG